MRLTRTCLLAGVGALILAFASSVVPANKVYADPVPVPDTAITQDNGSLVVHKHERTASNGTQAGNGTRLNDVSQLGSVISGVKFTAQKVKGVDLKTNAGWEKVAKLNGSVSAAEALGFEGQKYEQTTQTNGEANFSTLPVGLYLVKESDVSAAKKDNKAVRVVPAQPFLVTIPMTNPTNHNQWMYNIHVYPKNSISEITKTVNDKKVSVGQKATFTITAKIPRAETGNKITKFAVMDVWRHVDNLQFMNDPGDISVTVNTEKVQQNTHYDLSYRNSSSSESGYVRVKFKEGAGLEKINGNPDQTVKMEVKLKITAMPANGVLKNWAFLTPSTDYSDEPPNNPDQPTPPGGGTPPPGTDVPPPPIPSTPVEVKLGKVVIKKFKAGDDTKARLAGAKFKLYYCDDKDTPINVSGQTEWTTTTDKDLEISGLQVSNFYNGSAQPSQKLQYCLVETEAPTGYELLSAPIKFYLEPSGEEVTVATHNLDVPNSPANGGFNLPLTGSDALVILSLAGIALLGGGVFIAWARQRRSA